MPEINLDSQTLAAAHRAWASRLGLEPSELSAPGLVYADRPRMAAVVIVRFSETTVVAAPRSALSVLRGLAPQMLVNVDALQRALSAHEPTLIGAASLSFADAKTLPAANLDEVREATEADVSKVLDQCSAEERDESGLESMGARRVALSDDHQPAALSGYEVWNPAVAHMGVAVAPEFRGHGLGEHSARAAAWAAVHGGLVPQWRCRQGNAASERLRDRLGFVPVGEQIALGLGTARNA